MNSRDLLRSESLSKQLKIGIEDMKTNVRAFGFSKAAAFLEFNGFFNKGFTRDRSLRARIEGNKELLKSGNKEHLKETLAQIKQLVMYTGGSSSLSHLMTIRALGLTMIETGLATMEQVDNLTEKRTSDNKYIRFPLSYNFARIGEFSYIEHLLEIGFDFSKEVCGVRGQQYLGSGIVSYITTCSEVLEDKRVWLVEKILKSQSTSRKENLLNAPSSSQSSALCCASVHNCHELIKALIKNGAKIEESNSILSHSPNIRSETWRLLKSLSNHPSLDEIRL